MGSETLSSQVINISYLNCLCLRRHASFRRFMNCSSIIEDFLLGSIFLPSTFNVNNYRQFLETQLPPILKDVPPQIRNQMWFMHDGVPAYFIAREFLNNNYSNK